MVAEFKIRCDECRHEIEPGDDLFCKDCFDAKNKEIEKLESEIENLKSEIDGLKEDVADLKKSGE